MLKGEKFISVPQGQEIAIALNSVAHELNSHQCLTLSEQQRLLYYLEDLSSQVGKVLLQIDDAEAHYPQGAPKSYDDSLSRGRTRFENFEHDIERDTRDVRNMPICPGSERSYRLGLYGGFQLVKNWGGVRSTERSAATDVVTNQFTDRADPVGGGFLIGYRFAPFAFNVVVSPFASFDFMRAPVNHTFAGGSFLGSTANFMGTLGVKVGPQFDAFWLYGIGGFSVLNETLNINFLPVASSQSSTVPGGTAGLGGALRPSFLQGFGLPVSVFAEYQHFWWAGANFNQPVASPLFNYTFRRQDDLVKIGFTVDLNPPPPPVAPSGTRYVKALPAK